ncbi:MAG TPA: hypothetical protein V6D12_24475 [Candidatus Obscuribacterales bacterium]
MDKITHIRYRGFFVIVIYELKFYFLADIEEARPLVTWNGLGMPWFDPTDSTCWYRPNEIELMIRDIRRTIDCFLDEDDSIPF